MGTAMIRTDPGDNSGAEWGAFATLLAAVVVILLIRFLWRSWITRPSGDGAKPRRSRFVLVGYDNRVSTSKTIAAAWTIVVAFMVITVGYIARYQASPGDYLSNTLKTASLLYLVLLGGPYAAAVMAKVAVTNQVNNGALQKSTGTPGPLDVISDDSGATDLYDFQYTLFNLIAMIIVFALFLPSPAAGLPSIPDFLAALTGGAALTYTINKAASGGNSATLTTVVPQQARVGDQVLIYGQNLAAPAKDQKAVDDNTVVMVGGQKARIVSAQSDQVAFKVPPYPGAPWPNAPQDIELKTNGNDDEKKQAALTIIGTTPEITGVDTMTISASNPQDFTVSGRWFCSTDPRVDPTADTPSVALTVIVIGKTLPCQVKNEQDPGRDSKLMVAVPAELGRYIDAQNPRPASITVTRGDNMSDSFGGLSVVA